MHWTSLNRIYYLQPILFAGTASLHFSPNRKVGKAHEHKQMRSWPLRSCFIEQHRGIYGLARIYCKFDIQFARHVVLRCASTIEKVRCSADIKQTSSEQLKNKSLHRMPVKLTNPSHLGSACDYRATPLHRNTVGRTKSNLHASCTSRSRIRHRIPK